MQDGPLKILASNISVLTALVILAIKVYGYMETSALSFMAGILDSAIDAIASTLLAFAMVKSVQPPDRDHRFGHGKAEGLAAFLQSLFILGSGVLLVIQTFFRSQDPQPISETPLGIVLTLVVLVLTALLVAFQIYVIRQTGSIGITADSMHYKGDFLLNMGVLVTLALTHYMQTPVIDMAFALGVAGFFFYMGGQIAKSGLDMLMDRELSQKKRDTIIDIVDNHPEARGIHDLKTRQSGGDVFIEFHLEMDGVLSLQKAHDITHKVESIIQETFPDAIVTIHQEPAGIDDDRLDDIIKSKKNKGS